MAVDPVTINTALDQQSKTASSAATLGTNFNDFLTLLTTQLQHQDPLDPMDTAQFTNQLVAFSGVEQQINTNQKLDSLVSLNLGTAFTGALNYVGLDVSYLSSEMNFDGATPVKISYSLDKPATVSKISVYDEDGDKVYSTDGNKTVGKNDFTWDGSLTNGGHAKVGTYTVKIEALDEQGKAVDSTTVVTGRVRGIETQGGLIYALVGERAVSIGNILNAVQPGTAPADEDEGA